MALTWLRNREVFGPSKARTGDYSRIYTSLYSSVGPHKRENIHDYGGIFGLEFSPDGYVWLRNFPLFAALSHRTQTNSSHPATTFYYLTTSTRAVHEKARAKRKSRKVARESWDTLHGAQVHRDLRHFARLSFRCFPFLNVCSSTKCVLRLSRGYGEVKTFIIWHCLEWSYELILCGHKLIFTSDRKLNRRSSANEVA